MLLQERKQASKSKRYPSPISVGKVVALNPLLILFFHKSVRNKKKTDHLTLSTKFQKSKSAEPLWTADFLFLQFKVDNLIKALFDDQFRILNLFVIERY